MAFPSGGVKKILFSVACNYNENSTAHPCALQFYVSGRVLTTQTFSFLTRLVILV